MRQTKGGQRQLLVFDGQFRRNSRGAVKNCPGILSISANIPIPKYAGTHLAADFWNGKTIESTEQLEQLLRRAAKAAHSRVLQVSIHKFSPHGITGVVLLAESHIALHTWPEIGYTAVDIFTCGQDARPREALEFLRSALLPEKVVIREMKRGEKKDMYAEK